MITVVTMYHTVCEECGATNNCESRAAAEQSLAVHRWLFHDGPKPAWADR